MAGGAASVQLEAGSAWSTRLPSTATTHTEPRSAGDVSDGLRHGRGLSELMLVDVNAFSVNGSDVTGVREFYIGGTGMHEYTELDLTNSDNLVANNLGGTGPRFNDPCADPLRTPLPSVRTSVSYICKPTVLEAVTTSKCATSARVVGRTST